MRTRVLKPEEWSRINTPELPNLLPYVEPQNVSVVVVEDDAGEIVASVAAMLTTHFEGLWIDPAYRGNPGVVRSLIRELYGVPRARAEHWAFATAGEDNTRMETVCRRLGGRQMPPVKFYVMPLGD